MSDFGLSILLSWHVISVIIWLGSSASFVFVIGPSARLYSQEQKIAFFSSFLPAFSKIISGASISTVFAGIFLFGYVSSIDTSRMPAGWNLIFMIAGAVLGLVAIFLTLGVFVPLTTKFMKQNIALQDSGVSKNDSSFIVRNSSQIGVEAAIRTVSSVASALVAILITVVILMIFGVYF
jgi:hypothetical protein